MLSRRALLAGLAASACTRSSSGIETMPAPPYTFGWRLVPGQVLVALIRVTRRTGERREIRSEEWAYRVLRLDRGLATLEARSLGLGAGVTTEDRIESVPASPGEDAQLQLDRHGRLHGISNTDFAASVGHYAFALPFPQGPVAIHDEWPDPFAGFASALLPDTLEPRGQARTTLSGTAIVDGIPVARLDTRGTVKSRGPQLEIQGSARWNLLAGMPMERRLDIRASRLGGFGEAPGLLTVEVQMRHTESGTEEPSAL